MDALIWPAVVFLLVLVGLILFRAPLVRLIDRVSRAGKDGVSFERAQEAGEQKPAPLSLSELMKYPVSASALQREQAIQTQLQSFGLKDDSEKIAVLTRALASTRVELEFNDIAHTVFGSQLGVLVQLAGTRHGLQRTQAEALFKQAQVSFPELHGERQFEDWLRYLTASNLLVVGEDHIDISQYGSDFLKHLVDARLAYNRYG